MKIKSFISALLALVMIFSLVSCDWFGNQGNVENPKEYKRLKSEQKDTISVMEGKMTKKEFKEKYGHKPNTKI